MAKFGQNRANLAASLLCLMILFFAHIVDVATVDGKDRDFYKILGLKKNAKDTEIKKAYRQLTLQYHPDKNPGDDEAKQKFHDVADAYEVLSDNDKRRKYDRCGEECANKEESNRGGSPFGDFFGGMFQQ